MKAKKIHEANIMEWNIKLIPKSNRGNSDFRWYQWQKIIFFYATRVHPMKEHRRGRSPFSLRSFRYLGHHMVLILDRTSNISAHVWRSFGYLYCSEHLFRPRAVENLFFLSFYEIHIFFHTCATCSELPSNIIFRGVETWGVYILVGGIVYAAIRLIDREVETWGVYIPVGGIVYAAIWLIDREWRLEGYKSLLGV